MREILFRGKGRNDGKWYEGDLGTVAHKRFIDDGRDNARVIPETVGQFTGLTDKNGKRIFEGDIIKHHRRLWGEDVSDIGVVFWNVGTCQFRRTSSQNDESPQIWQSTAEHYEVIGNVHDNPELLEVKQ